MGWLRLVGSIKVYVSFVEYCLFYRAILQKRPIILSSLLAEATPYAQKSHRVCRLRSMAVLKSDVALLLRVMAVLKSDVTLLLLKSKCSEVTSLCDSALELCSKVTS